MLRTTLSTALLPLRLFVAALCVLGMAQFAVGQEAHSTSPPTAAVSVQPGKLPDDVEQVLWWLPEETETVVVSKGNVPIMELHTATPPTSKPSEPTLVVAPGYEWYNYPTYEYEYQDLVAMNCIEPLVSPTGLYPDNLQGKMLKSFYGPKTASLFVKAVWWDKDKTRENCDIVVFRDDMAARIVNALAAFRNVPRDFEGMRVLEVNSTTDASREANERYWGRPFGDDRRYVAAPRPNVYVAATSSALMKVILERMKRRGANRALPADLPEWQQFDLAVPAWGVRHYRPAIAGKDITSMLKHDPNAKGLVFFGGNKPSPFIGLRYVSNSEDAGGRFLRMKADWFYIKDASMMVPMQCINADCVESRMRINVSVAEAERDKDNRSIVANDSFWWIGKMYLPLLGFGGDASECPVFWPNGRIP
jgi:hypothetical protein